MTDETPLDMIHASNLDRLRAKLKARFENTSRPDYTSQAKPATMERTAEIRKFEREQKTAILDDIDAPF